MTARKKQSKRVRFEVFKRDSFKCQYCGAAAPESVLQIDHIKPVALGGDDELCNLITSCLACNSGKSDKPLDDASAVAKQRTQLEELQERREQLELLMEWKTGLRSVKDEATLKVAAYWNDRTPGRELNENGLKMLRGWLRKFSVDEITEAMDIAADTHLEFGADGFATDESWESAWRKIPGICRVTKESKKDPDLRELLYIRGIVRNRCAYPTNSAAYNRKWLASAMDWMRTARTWDIPLEELSRAAKDATSFSRFIDAVIELVDDAMRSRGIDPKTYNKSDPTS